MSKNEKPQKEKSTLLVLRKKWKEMTANKTKEEVAAFMYQYVGKTYILRCYKHERYMYIDGTGLNFCPCFLATNVLTKNEMRIPPWHLLGALEIPKRQICSSHPSEKEFNQMVQHAYQIIYDNWNQYLAHELSLKQNAQKSLTVLVEMARQRITVNLCPWYPKSSGWKIWQEAIIDLPRRMHESFIPTTKTSKTELW